MPRLLAALALFALAGPAADPVKPPASLESARKEYKAALTQAQTGYNQAANKAAEEQKQRLKELQQTETKAGNLDAAVAIRDELKALTDAGPPLLGGNEWAGRAKWVEGTWEVIYPPGKAVRTYVIKPDGDVTFVEEKRSGKLKPSGDSFLLDLDDGKLSRLTFGGGRVFDEGFDPKSSFGKGPPTVIGVGTLKKKEK